MGTDSIKSWDAAKGYGFSRGGVMVHASVVQCEHLAPRNRKGYVVRGFDIHTGTVVVLETERTAKGLRATSALCEVCGAPGVWTRVVCNTATDPRTGEVAEWVRYDHVSGSYRNEPKADNAAYDRVAAVASKFRDSERLHEDIFGVASFVRLDLDWDRDGGMAIIHSANAAEERHFKTNRLLALRPEWFTFSRIVVRRVGSSVPDARGGPHGYYLGPRRAKAYAVFILPSGQKYELQVAETHSDVKRIPRPPFMWTDEFFRLPEAVRMRPDVVVFRARMNNLGRLARWARREFGAELGAALGRYKARMAALAAPNSITLDEREGSWQRWVSDDWDGRHDGDASYNSGDYVTDTGTIFTHSCDGADVPPAVQYGPYGGNQRTIEGVRMGFERVIWRDLEALVTARCGDGSWSLLEALGVPYPG